MSESYFGTRFDRRCALYLSYSAERESEVGTSGSCVTSWSNPVEQGAQQYWSIHRKWRGIDDSGELTYGELIESLNTLRNYRGLVALRAEAFLDDVVHDRGRPSVHSSVIVEYDADNDITAFNIQTPGA
jgi:hypothetical protein